MLMGSHGFHDLAYGGGLVSRYKFSYPRSHGNSLVRLKDETGVGKLAKNGDFPSINHYISEAIEARHIVTVEDQ